MGCVHLHPVQMGFRRSWRGMCIGQRNQPGIQGLEGIKEEEMQVRVRWECLEFRAVPCNSWRCCRGVDECLEIDRVLLDVIVRYWEHNGSKMRGYQGSWGWNNLWNWD